MKKTLYIVLPLIVLSLIAIDACSAPAPQGEGGPPTQLRAGAGYSGPGGPPAGLREGKEPGGKRGAKVGIPHGRWWKRTMIQEKLKLTDEQIEKLEKVSLEGRKNMIKLRADLEIAELELEPLMEAKKFDREKVEAILDKTESIRAKMAKERIKTLLDTREILTSEQYQKLKQMKGRRDGRDGRGRLGKSRGQRGTPSTRLRVPQHAVQR